MCSIAVTTCPWLVTSCSSDLTIGWMIHSIPHLSAKNSEHINVKPLGRCQGEMGNTAVSRGVSRISDQAIPSKRTAATSLVDQISDTKLPNLLIYKDAGTFTYLLTNSFIHSFINLNN